MVKHMASTPGQNAHLVVPLVNSSDRCLKSLCRHLIPYHLVLSSPLLLLSSRRVARQLVVSLVKSPCSFVARQVVVSLINLSYRSSNRRVACIVNSSCRSWTRRYVVVTSMSVLSNGLFCIKLQFSIIIWLRVLLRDDMLWQKAISKCNFFVQIENIPLN